MSYNCWRCGAELTNPTSPHPCESEKAKSAAVAKVAKMSDEDVLAEVTDGEIEEIEERRSRFFRERADLMEKLSLVEADLEAANAERKTWLAEARALLVSEEEEG